MSVNSIEELKKYICLTEKELSWHESPVSLPVKITDYYMSLIDKTNPDDPLRHIVVPTCTENITQNLEDEDPLHEEDCTSVVRLIHRYSNRVAFLATDYCAQYCRHCFRRRFTGNMVGPATEKEIYDAASYIGKNTQIREMLLTGGDPLTLSDEELDRMIAIFRQYSPSLIIRICTRYPVVQPDRITVNLIKILKKHNTAPFYLMTHFNHPRELTKQAVDSVSLFVDNGIPAMNQSVLLHNVNDNADTMTELCNCLVASRIKPYYMFQGDLVVGTGGLRVPLEKGIEIEKEMRKRLSGLAMPVYCADLPDGGGKVPLCGSYIEGKEGNKWVFRTLDGQKRFYPDPE